MEERASSAPMIVSASQDLPDGCCRRKPRFACCRPQRVRARSCAFQQARSRDAAWQRASVLHVRLHSNDEGHHSLNRYSPLSPPRRWSLFRDARPPRASLIFAASTSSSLRDDGRSSDFVVFPPLLARRPTDLPPIRTPISMEQRRESTHLAG